MQHKAGHFSVLDQGFQRFDQAVLHSKKGGTAFQIWFALPPLITETYPNGSFLMNMQAAHILPIRTFVQVH